jgi:SAM-dependent methyltransferase
VDETNAFFDNQAARWSEQYEKDVRFRRRFQRISRLLDRVLPKPPARILDAGCGTGVFSRFLASRGYVVTAFDSSEEMILHACQLSQGQEIEFQNSNIEEFEAQPGSFEAIVSLSMLEYVDDDEAAIQKFHSLLKKDGILIISVPNRSGILRKLEGLVFGIRTVSRGRIFGSRGEYLKFQKRQYTPFELDILMRLRGLKKVRSIYLNGGVAGPRWLLPLLERRWWAAMYCGVYRKK